MAPSTGNSAAPRLTRRDLFRGVCGAALLGAARGRSRASELDGNRISSTGLELMEEIEKRACAFFYEHAHPVTGLVRDRVRVDGREDRAIGSIAATGFGLSALCIAHQRGYLTKDVAQQRVERTLEFFARRVFRHRGFYFHFLDCETGQRAFQ